MDFYFLFLESAIVQTSENRITENTDRDFLLFHVTSSLGIGKIISVYIYKKYIFLLLLLTFALFSPQGMKVSGFGGLFIPKKTKLVSNMYRRTVVMATHIIQ